MEPGTFNSLFSDATGTPAIARPIVDALTAQPIDVLASAPGAFAGGVLFYIVGAWPVGFFFGLDAVLIYWAFRVNYRAADAYEEVTVTPSELRVKKVTHKGKVSEWSMNPQWTQLERESHEDFGLMGLFLVSRGKRLRKRPSSSSSMTSPCNCCEPC